MTYQITVKQCGDTIATYNGIESTNSTAAIDRVIRQHYKDVMLEYNNELVVIGYEFIAKELGWWLS